jgi:hypothetical protein
MENKIDKIAVHSYYEVLSTFQNKSDNHILRFPIPPKYPKDSKTGKVLKAYRNMATVWSRAGGCIPKITDELIDLLFTMGTNHLMFNRKRHS